MKVLAFKIYGKFWHFRKFYTTTSPLTFSIIPFTTLRWIIAAILWKPKDTYNEEFAKIKLSQKLGFDATNKRMFWINLWQTKDSEFKKWNTHIQVKQEVLLNPCYTIYVSEENFKEYNVLKKYLENSHWEYTPYLGIAQFLANITYIGEFEAEKVNLENIEVDSIIPIEKVENGKNLIVEDWQFFEIEKVPFVMDNKRNLKSLKEFVFNVKWKKLKVKKFDGYKIGKQFIYLV